MVFYFIQWKHWQKYILISKKKKATTKTVMKNLTLVEELLLGHVNKGTDMYGNCKPSIGQILSFFFEITTYRKLTTSKAKSE